MNTPLPPPQKKLEFKLSVSTEAQGRQLEAAWREIVAGQQPRTDVLERDRAAITSRALYVGERQEAALAKLSEKTDLTPRELLDRAIDDLADKYRQKSGA